jgi:hypothetical protein
LINNRLRTIDPTAADAAPPGALDGSGVPVSRYSDGALLSSS